VPVVAQPAPQASSQKPARRRGCRLWALALGLLGILCCYAAVLAVEWSLLKDIF
jgi:hypothetical protein